MSLLQIREKEIFETLKKLKKLEFVVIGGYAVNAYTLPRFSVDCDIVLRNKNKLAQIDKILKQTCYKEIKADNLTSYSGHFARYEKRIEKGFKVCIDVLIKEILDRQTGTIFSSKWVFDNSSKKELKGKTITEKLKLRIINPDALIIMKFISLRSTDIRDVFMLIAYAEDLNKIKEEIGSKYDFKKQHKKIKDHITSHRFRDNLQGVYGYIDEKLFEKHKKLILNMG